MQTNRPDFSRRDRRARFAAPGEGCLDLWMVILTSDDSELFDSPGDLTKRATRTSHRKAICDGIEWRSPSADASIADLNLC
jgi:hypothetical protein